MLGIIISAQIMATPQKKNMKPFWRRPVISVPRMFVTMKRTMGMAASSTSLIGSSTPNARNSVLK